MAVQESGQSGKERSERESAGPRCQLAVEPNRQWSTQNTAPAFPLGHSFRQYLPSRVLDVRIPARPHSPNARCICQGLASRSTPEELSLLPAPALGLHSKFLLASLRNVVHCEGPTVGPIG